MSIHEVPAQYRPIGPYVKIASDFKDHDSVLYYWTLNYAVEKALSLGNPTSEGAKQYLISLLDVLEKIKEQHKGDESYIVGPVGQCHVEAKALRLFTNADEQDRQGVFNKNVIKSFYTSGLLFDVLSLFTKEELEEKLQEARKYAKWKATEINNCLKNGQTPQAGPPNKEGEDDELTRELMSLDVTKPQPTPRTTSNNAPMPNQSNQQPPPSQGYPPANQQNFGWQQPPQQQFNAGYGQQSQQQFGAQQGYPSQPQYQAPLPPTQQHYHNPPPPAAQPTGGVTLDECIEARRLTKMAVSALDYEDSLTAIKFLKSALAVLQKD